MKRKLLFYTPVTLQNGGGCERWHCDVSVSLKKQFKANIEIVGANLGNRSWSRKYLEEQLKGTAYTELQFPIFFGVLIPTPSLFFFLLKKFRSVDVVHCIYGFMGQDILMAILKFLTKKKVVIGHHAPIFHHSRVHNLYMRTMSRFVMRYFDFHQTLNSQDKNFLEKKWEIKNVYFIPSGVRVERFLKSKRIKHKDLIFTSVGRYELQKGFDLTVKAIEKFNHVFKKNRAIFQFAGDGSLKGLIQQYAKRNKNIRDLGFIPYGKIPSLYAGSDVYLLSSREEPFGLVLIEAWASGIPVLATKTEGPKDMLLENKNGWFINSISVEGIYNGIVTLYKKLVDTQKLFTEIEKRCRETGKLYSIDTTAKRMFSTFFQ